VTAVGSKTEGVNAAMCAPLAVVTLLLLRLLLRLLLVLLCLLLLLLLLSLGIRTRSSWILRSVGPAVAWQACRPNVLVGRRRS
jgi:O-antigen ligase